MSKSENTTGGSTLQTVSRAMAVLRCFSGGDRTLSLAELTKLMDLNKVTVFRLATTLVTEGVLAFDKEASRYRVSYGLIALGRKLLDGDGLRDTAHAFMEKARLQTRETICLSVREQWDQVVVHAMPSPQPVRYVLEVASRGPVYNGAAGQCLIAKMSETELNKLVSETGLVPTSDNSVTSIEPLTTKLTSICKDGYAISHGERISGAAATAAPIYDGEGNIIASLSIIMPKTRATGTHLTNCIRVVQETAGTISGELKSSTK
ncbi:IclR family transcriptional regulator [Kiloniella sp.]|uniref:IclR family transcriptional regulator n=1 Tax=Kiloniella sp. TaxID=1938587 RepID=UPI003B0155C6